MKNFLSKNRGYNVSHSNGYVATAFAVVVTSLLVGGYEMSQSATDSEGVAMTVQSAPAVQVEAIARMETIVVTAKRS